MKFKKTLTEKDIVAIPYGALPCSLVTFTIKGKESNVSYFVEMVRDDCPPQCSGYDCHNMHAESLALDVVRERIKTIHKLTDEDILLIQQKLEDILRVGDCGWCV